MLYLNVVLNQNTHTMKSKVLSDIEIAQACKMQHIETIAEKVNISKDDLELYGKFKAKLPLTLIDEAKIKNSHLILVTAMTPTPAGEGKTTTSIGLTEGLNKIGKRTTVVLREPSLGPVFGIKGGAAGGGYSQVVPMEDINLHFTGDFSAIEKANNLLSALIDNNIQSKTQNLNLDPRTIGWKRVMDMNDRSLRDIVIGLGGTGNGIPRQDGFNITPASEVMAILCMSENFSDLKTRLGNIYVGLTFDKRPIYARDLKAENAMAILLKDAIKPNLVQTMEGNPAIIHGGPFANIAHGCNSVVATTSAMKLADYVVTEAGFGADLGAEKFIDIKCRKTGLRPSACVLVATIRAIKYHGGADLKTITEENLPALEAGLVNLERHINNITKVYNLPLVVSINNFTSDTKAEVELLRARVEKLGVKIVLATHWADGGKGAADLAHVVVELCEKPQSMSFVYEDSATLWEKINAVATKIYGAKDVTADAKVQAKLKEFEASGYGSFPICVAKTQYSFSTDAALRGAPSGHTINVREVKLSAGAEFIVVICGEIMTMPGLPKVPSAERIDYIDGKVVGLF